MSTVYLRNRSNSEVVRTLIEERIEVYVNKKSSVAFICIKKLNDTMFIFPIDTCTISMALITTSLKQVIKF
jgi:hypothetical protein